ncbi:hypothetical protein [Actinomadura madurae]|nr:hypothetical protein [Actinomadura madurae]
MFTFGRAAAPATWAADVPDAAVREVSRAAAAMPATYEGSFI